MHAQCLRRADLRAAYARTHIDFRPSGREFNFTGRARANLAAERADQRERARLGRKDFLMCAARHI